MKYRNKDILIDSKRTLYESIDLPEKDEDIYNAIIAFRDSLESNTIRKDSAGLVEKSRDNMLNSLNMAINKYEVEHNISNLIQGYGLAYLGYVRAMLKEDERAGNISNKDLNQLMNTLFDNCAILSNQKYRAQYDAELASLRAIQGIQNETIRNNVLRDKMTREDLIKTGAIDTIDKSHLKGFIREKPGEKPKYNWNIELYKNGKIKIFDTRTYYKDNPDLSERVEVFAHGGFNWEGMYRKKENGTLDPTIINELCEVVSVRKTDKNGNIKEFYGIAQTKELGHLAKLNADELEDLEARGIGVLFLSDGRTVAKDLREGREPRYDAPANTLQKVRNKAKVKNTIARNLRKIGLEIPIDEEAEDIEPRVKLKAPSLSRLEIDPNKKYTVLVLEPKRAILDEPDKSRFAKLYLSDYLLDIARTKNGNYIGSFSSFSETNIHRLEDETISACQYASVSPGIIKGVKESNYPIEVDNLQTALSYIRRQDRINSQKREIMDFYGE